MTGLRAQKYFIEPWGEIIFLVMIIRLSHVFMMKKNLVLCHWIIQCVTSRSKKNTWHHNQWALLAAFSEESVVATLWAFFFFFFFNTITWFCCLDQLSFGVWGHLFSKLGFSFLQCNKTTSDCWRKCYYFCCSLIILCRYNLNSVTYGYMTWEWKAGIRGFFYPLLFASIYKILHFINYDSVHLLVSSCIFYPDNFTSESHFVFLILLWLVLQIWLPRVFQALLAAFADVKFFFLIRTLESRDVATWMVRRRFVWGNKRGEVPDGRGHLFLLLLLVCSSSAICARGSRGSAAPGLWPTAWRPPSPAWLFFTTPSLGPKHTAGLDSSHIFTLLTVNESHQEKKIDNLQTFTLLMFLQQKIFVPGGLGHRCAADSCDRLVPSADVSFLEGGKQTEAHHS